LSELPYEHGLGNPRKAIHDDRERATTRNSVAEAGTPTVRAKSGAAMKTTP
jgi:hypothetical protein